MPFIRRLLPALLVVLPVMAGTMRAQIPGAQITQARVTRGALDTILAQYEAAAQSNIYSGESRARFRRQAELVRARLADGDFQVGDRVLLVVEAETALTDTFTVETGRVLRLPNIGPVPLQGVLRSELTDHLTQTLTQFLRNPRVRAQALIRVTISGAVQSQGFYTVPVDIQVGDVFRSAGGPTGVAELGKMRIVRGDETMWQDDEVLAIITEGRTIDAINIQTGDHFIVPTQRVRNSQNLVQTISVLLSIPFSIAGLVALVR